jgi:sarcosine oxidase subunit alpha
MFRRTRAIAHPVTIHLDGRPIQAEQGEPLAVALLASDAVALARSPKLHRPRGPSCLRGGCDGCLARVDGVPNVMTCLHPASGGERIETQNVLGSRETDLLRMTDWFFPQGVDHHHLLVSVPGFSKIMQSFARKIAGLGRLPSTVEARRAAEQVSTDVIVIGGGPAGIAAASRLAQSGLHVLLVDDGLAIGGSLHALADSREAFLAAHPLDGVTQLSHCAAIGVYLGEVLLASEQGAKLARARAIVFATGAHDPALAVPNNDLPGVLSARALCRLLAYGVAPKGTVVIVAPEQDPWSHELEHRLGIAAFRVAPSQVEALHGSGRVQSITIREAGGPRSVTVAAVALGGEGAPAFELAEQAGAAIEHEPSGYRVVVNARGRVASSEALPLLYAVGEVTGRRFELEALARKGAAVGKALADELEKRA